jgi:hypothetical protein
MPLAVGTLVGRLAFTIVLYTSELRDTCFMQQHKCGRMLLAYCFKNIMIGSVFTVSAVIMNLKHNMETIVYQ